MDSNDISYQAIQFDFVYIGRQLFEIFGLSNLTYTAFLNFLSSAWDIYTAVALGFSAVLVVGIIYAYIRYNQMGDLETVLVETQEKLWDELYGSGASNNRWEEIEQHVTTDNPNDWKLAIIEADVMLEEMLRSAGYAGQTIGDKLKSASPNNFKTLDDAWRAHRVRNNIAHGGADFVLTKKLAQETIVQYKHVFQEFGIV
jgi:hypothetical protein